MKTVFSLSNVTIFKVNNLILVHKLLVSCSIFTILAVDKIFSGNFSSCST